MAKIENNIVLKIENEIISNYEVKNKILSSLMLNGQEINQKNINNTKKQALNALILFKLKKIELSKHNFKNDPKQISDYLNLISSNDIEKFKERFKRNNLDYELFIEEIETQFKWQKFIYQVYSNKIEIDELLRPVKALTRAVGLCTYSRHLLNQKSVILTIIFVLVPLVTIIFVASA